MSKPGPVEKRPDTDGWDETSRDLAAALEAHGWTVRLVDYCEDARTPGLLGAIRGVTDRDRREVKVGRKASPSPAERAAILAHELRHVLDPAWDCGNRDVFGRGGPPDDSPPLPLGWHEHGEPPAGVHQHGEYALHAHIDFAAPYAATGLAPQRPTPQQQREQMAAYVYAAGIVNDPVAMRDAERAGELEAAARIGRELECSQWACGGCGWEWPTLGPPPPGAECRYCSGYLLPRATGEGTP